MKKNLIQTVLKIIIIIRIDSSQPWVAPPKKHISTQQTIKGDNYFSYNLKEIVILLLPSII